MWREQPDLYISWENLSYTVKVPKRDTKVPTLVSGIAHALAKPVKAVAALVAGEHEHSYNILHALAPSSGVIRPGTMTLVLAPPGHGYGTHTSHRIDRAIVGSREERASGGVCRGRVERAAEVHAAGKQRYRILRHPLTADSCFVASCVRL